VGILRNSEKERRGVMIPSDSDLNDRAMEACGWELTQFPGSTASVWTKGDDMDARWKSRRRGSINFTGDRNALPELRDAIEKAGRMNLFELRLCQSLIGDFAKDDELPIGYLHKLVFAEPRTVVIAGIRALGKWPDEWEE
jgi:hypothetical protein